MGRYLSCDMCGDEPAALIVTTIEDGSTSTAGANCAPALIMGMAVALGLMPDPTEAPAPEPKPVRRSRGRSAEDASKTAPSDPQTDAEAVSVPE